MMKLSRWMVLLILTGCSGPEVLNAIVPHEGYHIVRDIAYGDQPRQLLDVYVPDHVAQPATAIVFFHGGSWQSGRQRPPQNRRKCATPRLRFARRHWWSIRSSGMGSA